MNELIPRTVAALVLGMVLIPCMAPGQDLPPIERVEVGANAEIRVNGEPFFPIMSWLQDTSRFPLLRSIGVNTFVGNHQHKPPAKAFGDAARAAGGYGIAHFGEDGVGHPYLLAWIHGDEPDISTTTSDAEVVAGPNMKVNKSTPLARIVDGVTHSWSVLDPMQDASFTIKLPSVVTVEALAIHLTISKGLAVASEVAFFGDGKQLLRTPVEARKGQQKFALAEPATFSRLEVRVLAADPGDNGWGSVGEIEGFDKDGKNVLYSAPYQKLRKTPEEVVAEYRAMKAADPSRPTFMTLTGRFLPNFTRFTEANRKKYYPAFVQGSDIVGFDIYPVYGWARPDWLFYVAEGTRELRRLAGPGKPVYAWIETCKGSQWLSDAKQLDVLPAHTRAEVWMAIIEGASAIGYFTHAWKPRFSEFAPTAEMQAELKRLNAQVTRLAPAILASPFGGNAGITFEPDLQGHLKVTEHDGALYVFAQNMDMQGRAGRGTITIAGLRAGTTITVLDESEVVFEMDLGATRDTVAEARIIKAEAGSFSDDFKVLQEHIYRLEL